MHGIGTNDIAKKSKSSRGPLSNEEFERAKQENICFSCLGNHAKKDCPKLKPARPNKDKQVHMA